MRYEKRLQGLEARRPPVDDALTDPLERAWIRDRKLTAIRIGREWRVREEDIQEFIQRHLSTAALEIHGTGD
jgi:excisionase family DNA binding protein